MFKQNSKLSIVILAAGKGTRLGGNVPKPLTVLPDGETILGRQVKALTDVFPDSKINLVIGYKAESLADAFPKLGHIYAAEYDTTNTSKSLLSALKVLPAGNGVLWLNGDVVFDEELIFYVSNQINQSKSFITVNTSSVADEEVKYTTVDGNITRLSKTVPLNVAEGEAVGINYVAPGDVLNLKAQLYRVSADAYFEQGIENSIRYNNSEYTVLDMTKLGLSAVEVDFATDLSNAEKTFF